MRVGVYIDAFNLYYGARGLCGPGTSGWRWLDLRSLVQSLLNPRYWPDARIDRVVYCTAPIDGATNRSGRADQVVYINALRASGSVDHVELGKYIATTKSAPLAVRGPGNRPQLVTSKWPVVIKDASHGDVQNARFMVSYAYRQEKGSDVNVAAHLLIDALERAIDAAVVISNDSDLRFPIQEARRRIPVGTVNPSGSILAGDLRGNADDGAGRHWWRQLTAADYRAHQLPDPVGSYSRPAGW